MAKVPIPPLPRLLQSFCFLTEKIYKTLATQLEFLRVVFSILFLVFRYPDETLSLVLDIVRIRMGYAQ